MEEKRKRIHEAAEYIKSLSGYETPEVGIVLGSGLGKLGDSIENIITVPYSSIPNFCRSTAIGHKGNLIIGKLGGKTVCAMQGRFHFYEGYSMDQVTLPVRVMKLLGVKYFFVSNASGGLNANYRMGELAIIRDHINLMPNPLIGPNFDEMGERFPDMTCAYDQELIDKAEEIAIENRIKVHKSIYLANSGPSYETPAEVRFYRQIGADLVGMSTVPEVIVARQCGLRVFGMSIVTNISNDSNFNHILNDGDDVIRVANTAADKLEIIFRELIKSL